MHLIIADRRAEPMDPCRMARCLQQFSPGILDDGRVCLDLGHYPDLDPNWHITIVTCLAYIMGRMVSVRMKSDKCTDGMSDRGNITADNSENPTSLLKGVSDIRQDMRLMEIIEDGSKIQIVIEDVSPEDADAVHRYQLAQGEGRLTIAESGITYEG